MYASLAPASADEAMVRSIVAAAQTHNVAAGISSALMLYGGYYLQLIEGERGAVQALFDRIRRDPRHFDVRRVALTTIEAPVFAGRPLCRVPVPGVGDAALATFLKRLWRGLGDPAQAVAAQALMHQLASAAGELAPPAPAAKPFVERRSVSRAH